MRMDKWLWAARFFKTRGLAAEACDKGRVESNGQTAKPAREVRIGDTLEVTKEGDLYRIEVLALSEIRGPATAAAELYREHPEAQAQRLKLAQERKAMHSQDLWGDSKPSKKNRRDLNRLRGFNE